MRMSRFSVIHNWILCFLVCWHLGQYWIIAMNLWSMCFHRYNVRVLFVQTVWKLVFQTHQIPVYFCSSPAFCHLFVTFVSCVSTTVLYIFFFFFLLAPIESWTRCPCYRAHTTHTVKNCVCESDCVCVWPCHNAECHTHSLPSSGPVPTPACGCVCVCKCGCVCVKSDTRFLWECEYVSTPLSPNTWTDVYVCKCAE